MSDSEDDIEHTWNIGCSVKSKDRYENTYKIFKKWCEENKNDINEEVLLAYFVRRNKELKAPSSLWAEYSMLKTTIFFHDSIDISKFSILSAFLKRQNVGYRPKKASAFSKEEMFKFLTEAPDEKFLVHKVAMILGVAGECRREELYNLTINDIDDRNIIIIVKILNTKTNIKRTFTVLNTEPEKFNYLQTIRKYTKLRPKNTKFSNLFMKYHKGKCCNQVVGKGTIGRWPSQIADYLKLPNPASYTGHSFRRTSLTYLANTGSNAIGLRRHESWKFPTVAEGYVEDSFQSETQFAENILQVTDSSSDSNETQGTITNTEKESEESEIEEGSTIDAPENQEIESIYIKQEPPEIDDNPIHEANKEIRSALSQGIKTTESHDLINSILNINSNPVFLTPKPKLSNKKLKPNEEDLSMKTILKRNENRDEFQVYGELITHKIRNLRTEYSKATVQHLINNILYDAQIGKYDFPPQAQAPVVFASVPSSSDQS